MTTVQDQEITVKSMKAFFFIFNMKDFTFFFLCTIRVALMICNRLLSFILILLKLNYGGRALS